MLDGKMLRAPTGTPMRRIALANRPFALAEPDPFTLANLTTKSFVAVSGFDMDRAECLRSRDIEAAIRHGVALNSGMRQANEGRIPLMGTAGTGLWRRCGRARRRLAGAEDHGGVAEGAPVPLKPV